MILDVCSKSFIDLKEYILRGRRIVEGNSVVSISLKPFNLTSKEQGMEIDDAMLNGSVHVLGVYLFICYFLDEKCRVLFEVSAGVDHRVDLNEMVNLLSFVV
jgi:hypothetical protein